MKKSIFLIFAAILCAMSANAKVVYLKLNDKWSASEARYYVHVWGGSSSNTSIEMQAVEGETNMYKIEVGTHNSIIFLRHKTTTTVTDGNKWNNLLNRLGNLSIPEDKNCCTINNGVTTVENENDNGGASSVTWSTYTPAEPEPEPEPVETHDITVKAKYPATWTAGKAAIHFWGTGVASPGTPAAMTKDGDWWTYTVTGVPTTSELSVIFINGDGWNGDANQTVDITGINESTCYQVTAGSGKALAAKADCETGEGEVIETHDITVKAFYPAAWNAGKAAVHFWGDGVAAPGTPAAMTKDGDWWSYTVTGVPTTSELSVIFINGDGWNGDANQTVDITGVNESTCYQVTAGSGKASAAVVDCASTPVVAEDVYTVVGSDVLLGTAWDLNNADNEMTKQADGSYVLVKENVDLAKTGTYEYKVVKNHDWGWSVPSGSTNKTLKLGNEDVDGTYNVTFTLNKELNALTASLELVEAKKVIPECYVAGDESLTGQNWNAKSVLMTYDEASEVYTATLTAVPAGTHNMKVVYGGEWLGFDHLATPAPANVKEGEDKKIQFTLAEAGNVTVTYHATNGIGLTGNFAVPETKYYIAGTQNLTGFDWQVDGLEIAKEGDVYKHTFSEMNAGTYEFKITDGTWTNQWGFSNLAANYVGVEQGIDGEGNPNGNIKIITEEAKNIIVIFDLANNKITLEGWEEKAPAEPVTVYFINSGEWAEVACYYWGGLNGSAWPGVPMTATGETYEAEGWNVYKVTFPGDNTQCIFTDNKAEGATQTGDLEVHDGQYYCYANGIWYERLADVDLLDTRVYLKGDMNEWCATEGWCDMFRKETVDGTVVYREVYLEAATTYEFKIEDAGTWLSNEGEMTKENCTGWLFEEGLNNAKITTEHAGDYIFVWNMETKHLSVVYPELTPEVMDLMVTDMVFNDETMAFFGTNSMMGPEFVFNLIPNLATGNDGVFELDAASTVTFGDVSFTDVTGTIAPDTETFASASAEVYGFYMGMYFQLNVEMSAGGSAGVPVEILNGTASVNGASELWITGQWEGDDVYVQAPGFPGESYECDEVWFYVGGTDWETASIIAFGPASITVEGNDVTVEGTVMSGMTGTNYGLFVIGTLPAEETPDYTRAVTSGNYGTICLPFGGTITGAVLYECVGRETGKVYLGSVNTLAAGVPYIFQATATELAVYSDGTTAAAGSSNGLYGTFVDETVVAAGNYILLGNTLRPSNGEAKVNANRAYLVMSEVPAGKPQTMPGRRYIGMSVQGENETTGVEDLFSTDAPVKVIENGQLIIIRDGVKYNVQGQVIR